MKIRKVAVSVLLLISLLLTQTVVWAAPDGEGGSSTPDMQFKAGAELVMNLDSGKIYFGRNIDNKMYPASTTKIMTAILALENGNLFDILTVSDTAIALPAGSSSIGLLRGEQLTLDQLMYALLVASANDAANVIAEHIAGSIDQFVVMMNEKAKELGALNTNFANAHGIHDENHYTTARDLAIIAQYAMKIEAFREYVKVVQYVIPPTNKYKEDRILNSTNRLINKNKGSNYLYKNAIGVKTGFTTPAQHCLVGAADNGIFSLLTVVLGAPLEEGVDYSFTETAELFDWGFANYAYYSVIKRGDSITEAPIEFGKEKDAVLLKATGEIQSILPKGFDEAKIVKSITVAKDVKAPVKKGDILGSITYSFEGEELGTVNLEAAESIERDSFLYTLDQIKQFVKKPIFWVPILIIVLLIVVLLIIRQININKRKRRRVRYIQNHRSR